MRFGNAVYVSLSVVSPIIYLAAYVVAIPLFAAIYDYFPGQVFYAPYARYEPTGAMDAKIVSQDILASTRRSLARSKADGRWQISADRLRISRMTNPEPDIVVVRMLVDATRIDPAGEIAANWPMTIEIPFEPSITMQEDGRSCRQVRLLSAPEDYNSDVNQLRNLLFTGSPPCHFSPVLELTAQEDQRLRSFIVGVSGNPAFLTGYYSRLLYYSATSITTVGFGDIVPLTWQSRLITSIEAISGWVLSGLFFNAVAWRLARLNVRGK